MADSIKKVEYKGQGILVEAAARDRNGYLIDKTYLKLKDALTKSEITSLVTVLSNNISTINTNLENYALKSWVEGKSYITTTQSASDIATASTAVKTWVTNQAYLTEHQSLSEYAKSAQVTTDIATAVTDMATKDWVLSKNYLTDHQSLANYYTKDVLYTQEEIDNKLSAIPKFDIKVVDELPTGLLISKSTIYLKTITNTDSADLYEEYIRVGTSWEKLGTAHVNLDGYATENWVTNKNYLTTHQSLSAYSTTEQMTSAIAAAVTPVQSSLNTHTSATNNPHAVTKAQVGLGNVANKTLDTAVTADSGNYITSGAVKTYVDNYVEENSSKFNAYKYIKQIDNYLFEVQYSARNEANYATANAYFKTMPRIPASGCTGVVKGNRVLRQMDWYYDDNVEFIVRTNADKDLGIHASIGVASGISGLTKSFVESGEYNAKYAMVPFIITDGINDAGLYIQSNVVVGENFDINKNATNECCVTMVNRYILDHCSSFEEVEEFFNTYHIYGTSAVEYNYHFLLVQRGEVDFIPNQIKWEVIEITPTGHITVTKGTDENQMPNGIMANFRTYGLMFSDNDIDINSVETYGIGVERYQLATKAFTEDDYSLEDLRTELMYSNAYQGNIEGAWRTEFAGYYSGDHKLTVVDAYTDPALYNDVLEAEKERFENKTRNDGAEAAWQTVHSCIYDIDDRSFNIVVQENQDNVYKFRLSPDVINDNVDDGENSTYSISKIQSLLYEEYETRNAAIESLNDSIINESTERSDADTSLQTNITNEVTARTNADTTLQNNINLKQDKLTSTNAGECININVTQPQSQSSTSSRLPEAYQEVEYLQSSGTQWIDTGVYSKNITSAEVKFNISNTNNYTGFGDTSVSTGNGYPASMWCENSAIKWYYSGGSPITLGIHDTDITATLPFPTQTAGSTVHIFRANGAATDKRATGKFYYVRLLNGSNIVFNGIPCYRKSDSVAGMYDLANSGKNLLNPEVIDKMLNRNDGITLEDNAGILVTNYIDTSTNKTFTLSNGYGASRIYKYGENGVFLNSSSTIDVGNTITFDSNVKSIRLQYNYTDVGVGTKYLQFEVGSSATSYEPYPFYTNAGTGTFTAGPDVTSTSSNTTNNNTEGTLKISFVNTNNYQTATQVTDSISTHNSNTSAHSDIRQALTTVQNSIPTKTSDIENDSGFITNAVNDLTNYYLKSETYTRDEVAQLISALSSVSFQLEETLPTASVDYNNKIVLVPASDTENGNIKDEYIALFAPRVGWYWEKIGSTAFSGNYSDLTGVPTKLSDFTNDSEFITASYHDDTKQDALTAGDNISIDENNVIKSTFTLPIVNVSQLSGTLTDSQIATLQKDNAIIVYTDSIVGSRTKYYEFKKVLSSISDKVMGAKTILFNSIDLSNDGNIEWECNVDLDAKTYVITNSTIHDNSKQNTITSTNKISADLIDDVDATNKFVTAQEKTDIADNTAARHSHSNKVLLDTYTQTESDLSDAVSKKHSHSNTSVLDSISSDDISNWNNKQPAGSYMTLDTEQTATAKKTFSRTEPIVLGGQETILNVLSTRTSDEMNAQWCGRMKIGNKDKTFLLGVYRQAQLGQPAICGIGAHKWSDSFAEKGASWEDIYLEPDGDKAVYIGGKDWRANSGWFKVQNNGDSNASFKSYINTGTAQTPTWRTILPNMAIGNYSIFFSPYISNTHAQTYCTSLGAAAVPTNNYVTNIGYNATGSGQYGTAIGYNAKANASYAVQLGYGTNSNANTFNVGLSSSNNYQLLNASGKIPNERLQVINDNSTTSTTETWSASKLNTAISAKSIVTVSATGTATDEVQYITINGTEKKLAGGNNNIWVTLINEDGDAFQFNVPNNWTWNDFIDSEYNTAEQLGGTPLIRVSNNQIGWIGQLIYGKSNIGIVAYVKQSHTIMSCAYFDDEF